MPIHEHSRPPDRVIVAAAVIATAPVVGQVVNDFTASPNGLTCLTISIAAPRRLELHVVNQGHNLKSAAYAVNHPPHRLPIAFPAVVGIREDEHFAGLPNPHIVEYPRIGSVMKDAGMGPALPAIRRDGYFRAPPDARRREHAVLIRFEPLAVIAGQKRVDQVDFYGYVPDALGWQPTVVGQSITLIGHVLTSQIGQADRRSDLRPGGME